MRILAGDVGGTKTLLRRSRVTSDGVHQIESEERFETESAGSIHEILAAFCRSGEPVDTACLAVAGPVAHGRAVLTNLGWTIEAEALRESVGARSLELVNDFWAVAYGVPHLERGDVHPLNAGSPDTNFPIGILGAGTGLGQAALVPGENGWRIVASEGGHCDFAPIGGLQRELQAFLEAELGHVSYERLVSGQGIANIHRFLHRTSGTGRDPDVEADEIAALAEGGDETASRALDLFVDIYAAEAGNLALKFLARGGIYLAGGIAPRHLRRLERRFMPRFVDKGRFESLMRTIPVHVITESRVGLIGAAARAAEL